MSDLYNSIRITSVAPTITSLANVGKSTGADEVNPIIDSLVKAKLGNKKPDRFVMYNPDAVGLWLYQKYTPMFTNAVIDSDLALPLLSVMPSVTPVCFASMYTGVMPDVHGIKKYEKPVLKTETVFDRFIANGKKCAIVSTDGDSISKIFLEREMDYFIYDEPEEVNEKALSLLDEDKYDLIVIYNGNYDGYMHKYGPESKEAMEQLQKNLDFYKLLGEQIKEKWKNHDVFYGFCPDHGCHEIDGGCGSHGLDMEDDMNIIHFYSIKPAE